MVNADTIKENLRSIVFERTFKIIERTFQTIERRFKIIEYKKSLGLILFFYKPITFFL